MNLNESGSISDVSKGDYARSRELLERAQAAGRSIHWAATPRERVTLTFPPQTKFRGGA